MKMKKIISTVLTMAMLIGLVSGMSITAVADSELTTNTITQDSNSATMAVSVTVPEKEPVSYIDADGTEKQTGTDYYNVRSTVIKWGKEGEGTWYVVDKDVEIAGRITVSGAVNLILCDGATLTAQKGITFARNEHSLTVYGQSGGTGALIANGAGNEAGIGGNQGVAGGNVTINGGNITATSAYGGAGIGGGDNGAGGTTTINGGVVNATGGNGAGIGGGFGGGTGTTIINGGTVTAVGHNSPGIGFGEEYMYSDDPLGLAVAEGMTIVAGGGTSDAEEKASASDLNRWSCYIYIEKSEPKPESVSYLDENGETKTVTDFTLVKPYSVNWGNGWYVVNKDVTITGEVTVDGNAKFILCDGATLTVEKQISCVGVGRSLAIYGQANGTGTLRVKGDNVGMNLGQGDNAIYGGTLDVSGISVAISVVSMGQFTIAGGTVNAAASRDTGSGINVTVSAKLTIEGGTVTASGRGKAIDVANYPGVGYGTMNIAPNMVAKAGADEQSAVEVDTLSGTDYKYAQIKAAEPKEAVKYIDENGEEQTTTDYFTVNANTKFATDKFYVVSEDVAFEHRITPAADHVKLILADGKTMTVKGLANTGSKVLSIYGQSEGTGTLSARGNGGAAIGGNDHEAGGTVNIYGGSVNATGSNSGAGIGGGNEGAGGTVNIYGGTVTATGGKSATGIGGGYKGNGGTVNVYGGTVTANGGDKGAGIGGGRSGNGGTVNIYGGTVTATTSSVSGTCAAIGQGDKGTGGTVNIHNGLQVKAGEAATETIVTDFTTNANSYKWASIGKFHTHKMTNYALSKTNAKDDTITAKCTEDLDNCNLEAPDYKATVTIVASTEGGGKATLTGNASDFGVTDADIKYTKDGQDITAEQITDTGFYKASITVGEKTAYITYGVNEVKKDTAFDAKTAHGDFTVPAVATANATVTIETTPDTGYELKAITVKKADNSVVTSAVDGNKGTFTMPEESVTVSAEFKLHDYTITKSEMTNGSVTVSGTAKMGDTVTLTPNPATGYELDTLTVKDSENKDITVTNNTLTMPASDITVSATFKLHNYTITKSEMTNGSVTVSDTAKMGDTVSITVKPDAGYELDTLKYNNNIITADKEGKYKFTMGTENTSISATFKKRNVSVSVNVEGNDNTTCTAEILDDDFTTATQPLTKQVGDTFTLLVSRDDDYDFNITVGANDVSMTEFTKEEYEAYLEYADKNGIIVPANTVLKHVTMPGIADDSITLTLTFAKQRVFTILYKPTDSSTSQVWCKFDKTEAGNTKVTDAIRMKSDAVMGDGTAVYSLKVKAGFEPTKVAFATAPDGFGSGTMTNISIIQSAPTQNSNWTNVSGGKTVVIGGNAKTAIAAFVSDADAMQVYKDNNLEQVATTEGVDYSLAVVIEGSTGTVTAPAGPTKEGYTFKGWRGYKYDANGKASEQVYTAGSSVPVRENTTLSAVWEPIVPNVKLNPNNGDDIINTDATYGDPVLKPEDIEKIGFVLKNWKVGKSVTENGKFFQKGLPFDFSTGITNDLELDAEWKHVHSYTYVPLNYSAFGDALSAYYKYLPYLHVKFCACADVELEAHTFKNGVCTGCGYSKPGATEAKLETFYWKEGATSAWMAELPKTVKVNEEVQVSACWQIGDYQFSKWQYSINNGETWNDLASDNMIGFIIPRSMQLRALYVNTLKNPQISLSARNYVTEAQGYNWDTVLYQMDYKLPDGYTLVDAGIRMGDNAGISYYEMKERTITMDAGAKAIATGICVVTSILSGGINTYESSATETYYAERENSVLDELTAATLSEYMLKSKPVNVEKYPPIYWEAKATSKGRTGSVNTLTPLRFIQKNNGNHYIYGMAYLTYKTPSGETKTIYTEALPTTRDNIPTYTVKADPKGMTNTMSH